MDQKFLETLNEKRLKAIQDRKNKKEVNVNGTIIQLDTVPNYQREYYLKLEKIGNSPTKAIMAKCYECSGYSISEANNCKCKDCALWVYLHRNENNS